MASLSGPLQGGRPLAHSGCQAPVPTLIQEDGQLTPSQRRKRPLSTINESETGSDGVPDNSASESGAEIITTGDRKDTCDAYSTNDHLKKSNKSGKELEQDTSGKKSLRSVASAVRCSVNIRKMTDRFERAAGAGSPSRLSPRSKENVSGRSAVNKGCAYHDSVGNKSNRDGGHGNTDNNNGRSKISPRGGSFRSTASKSESACLSKSAQLSSATSSLSSKTVTLTTTTTITTSAVTATSTLSTTTATTRTSLSAIKVQTSSLRTASPCHGRNSFNKTPTSNLAGSSNVRKISAPCYKTSAGTSSPHGLSNNVNKNTSTANNRASWPATSTVRTSSPRPADPSQTRTASPFSTGRRTTTSPQKGTNKSSENVPNKKPTSPRKGTENLRLATNKITTASKSQTPTKTLGNHRKETSKGADTREISNKRNVNADTGVKLSLHDSDHFNNNNMSAVTNMQSVINASDSPMEVDEVDNKAAGNSDVKNTVQNHLQTSGKSTTLHSSKTKQLCSHGNAPLAPSENCNITNDEDVTDGDCESVASTVPDITITPSEGLTGMYHRPPPVLGPTVSSASNITNESAASGSTSNSQTASNHLSSETDASYTSKSKDNENDIDVKIHKNESSDSSLDDYLAPLVSCISNAGFLHLNNTNDGSSNHIKSNGNTSSSDIKPLLHNSNFHNHLNVPNLNSNKHAIYSMSKLAYLNTSKSIANSGAPLLPYYKFLRRLSTGGSSICEEDEEDEESQTVHGGSNGMDLGPHTGKLKLETEEGRIDGGRSGRRGSRDLRVGAGLSWRGEGRLSPAPPSSPSLLLSERGSSVSSISSISSNECLENGSPPRLFGPFYSSSSSLSGTAAPASIHQLSVSDLSMVKETADKLRLTTRRASTQAWRQKYMDNPGVMRKLGMRSGSNAGTSGISTLDGKLTQDRKQRIDDSLEWLREELQEMRALDQSLARQLLTIRQDIYQLKLQRCTEEHQDLIDDFQNELEELQEFSDVLDLPQPVYEGDNPLRHVGVTKLNLFARRFSAC